ncbi:MAG TPA: glycoside hydrolase family 43 protein [Acidimicrobiales bacterium]|nr:glycoside hydrolase family 43 protein [Acidimicrobiales bacterium]
MRLLDAFRERRPFPGQDPWVVANEGELLLVQSAGGNRRIVVKRFHDLERMNRNTETVIWRPRGAGAENRQLWAPELHHLDGRWYVYFAASDGHASNHRTYAIVADDPLGPYRALGPVRDVRHDVWAIDMTVFTHEGRLYALWSGWEGVDDGFPQNLYIAPMANPWTVSGERTCLSRPEHGWEMSVAPVNEGPEVIRHPQTGRLFILYAADASWTQAYKTGLLEWTGGDVVDPASWHKLPRPFFTGGGHGCVVDTPAGLRLVYHRKVGGDPGWADREIRWAPFGWDPDGSPAVRLSDPPDRAPAAVGGPGAGGLGPAVSASPIGSRLGRVA